jgi:hypothetical protein
MVQFNKNYMVVLIMLSYKQIHLMCRRNSDGNGFIGLHSTHHPKFSNAYITGKWKLRAVAAQSLLGGLVFLHETKAKPSYLGGLIYDWEISQDSEKANEKRISFKFLAAADARYVRWAGKNHMMAWQSEVVPPDGPFIRDVPPLQRHVGRGYRQLADLPEDFVIDLQKRALTMPSD